MTDARTECWGLLELEPAGDAPVEAVFRHGDRVRYAASFTDSDGRHLLRFMPDAVGEWTYRLGGSDRPSGRFECVPAGPDNHGPVRVAGDRLRYADGTAFVPVGTTWLGSGDPDGLGHALVATPFNRVRIAASPEPAAIARLDAQVRSLTGTEVEVILYGAGAGEPADDEAYLRHLVARLAAYRNVSWCLAVESGGPSSPRRDWTRLAELVRELDHGAHLLTLHAPRGGYDFGQPWLTHVSVSLENLRRVSSLVRDYGKPVFVDHVGYEGDGAAPDRSLTAADLVARVWEGTVRGGHVTHGEWFADGDAVPWSDGGPRPVGESAPRLRLLRQVLEEMPAGAEPVEDYRDAPTLAVPGEYYLQYLNAHGFGERTFSLPPGAYRVDVIDTWEMTVRTLARPVSGEVAVKLPATPYQAVRIRRVP